MLGQPSAWTRCASRHLRERARARICGAADGCQAARTQLTQHERSTASFLPLTKSATCCGVVYRTPQLEQALALFAAPPAPAAAAAASSVSEALSASPPAHTLGGQHAWPTTPPGACGRSGRAGERAGERAAIRPRTHGRLLSAQARCGRRTPVRAGMGVRAHRPGPPRWGSPRYGTCGR